MHGQIAGKVIIHNKSEKKKTLKKKKKLSYDMAVFLNAYRLRDSQ
jgi:hypothetical protein